MIYLNLAPTYQSIYSEVIVNVVSVVPAFNSTTTRTAFCSCFLPTVPSSRTSNFFPNDAWNASWSWSATTIFSVYAAVSSEAKPTQSSSLFFAAFTTAICSDTSGFTISRCSASLKQSGPRFWCCWDAYIFILYCKFHQWIVYLAPYCFPQFFLLYHIRKGFIQIPCIIREITLTLALFLFPKIQRMCQNLHQTMLITPKLSSIIYQKCFNLTMDGVDVGV